MSKDMNYKAMWEELFKWNIGEDLKIRWDSEKLIPGNCSVYDSARRTLQTKMEELEKKADPSPTICKLWVPLKYNTGCKNADKKLNKDFVALFLTMDEAKSWFTCICEIGAFPKSYGGSFFNSLKLSKVDWSEVCYVSKEVRELCKKWGCGEKWLSEHQA